MKGTMNEDVLTDPAEHGEYRVSTPTTISPTTSASTAGPETLTKFNDPAIFADFHGGFTFQPDLIETHPPPGEVTPPAALSTLGIRMAELNQQSSTSELEDGQYDMLDDASEFSTDRNETASLASLDEHSSDEDGQLTPEETGSVVDLSEPRGETTGGVALQDYQMQLMLLEQQNKKRLLLRAREAQEEAANREAEKTEVVDAEKGSDSFMTDDLETPRQSTVAPRTGFKSGDAEGTLFQAVSPHKPKISKGSSSMIKQLITRPVRDYGLLVLLISLASWMFANLLIPIDPAVANAMRKDALSNALIKHAGIIDATKVVNVDHLLPMPTRTSTSMLGQPHFGTSDVHFQGLLPNTIIVSLPYTDRMTPVSQSAEVFKADKPLAFNLTMLIPGVFEFDFDEKEAFGIITVHMQTTKPSLNVTVSHNFGGRIFKKQTYEKARTDLTKAMNKDVNIARKSAKSLTERLQLEIGAGVAATKNVTTQIAVHINRDLQLWASNTASVLTKAAVAGNHTYFSLRKDLMRIEQRLDDAGEEVVRMVVDAGSQVAKSVTEPLLLSRERAVALKDRLFGCKQGLKSKKRAHTAVGVAKRAQHDQEGRILRSAARKLKKTAAAGKENGNGKKLPSMKEKRQVKPHGKKGAAKQGV